MQAMKDAFLNKSKTVACHDLDRAIDIGWRPGIVDNTAGTCILTYAK
jgi:hypothetical protein